MAIFMGRVSEVIGREALDTRLLALGALLDKQQWLMPSREFNDYEFKIFSEWGDDGLIQYLIKNVPVANKTFIEFGVENYLESNTRFLMMNNNWSGYVMDGSAENMRSLRNRSWFFKYDLRCKAAWIDRENINELTSESSFTNLGLLHIDLDGIDYFVLEAMDFTALNPSILILEYNFLFGIDRPISVPYDKGFERRKSHYSNLFFGASLPALTYLAEKKGYALVGCNSAGNNAYFVRRDLLNDRVRKQEIGMAFRAGRFRQGRTPKGRLSFLPREKELELIKGLQVINVITGSTELL